MRGVTAGIVVLAFLLVGTREGSAHLLDRNCGISRSDSVTFRIAGGTPTSTYQNPWMVRVISGIGENQTMCYTGFVLTAAHCPIFSYTYVLLGDPLTEDPKMGCTSENCTPKLYRIDVDQKLIHQNYKGEPNRKFDIALLRMKSEVAYSDFVRPICLLVDEPMEDVSAFNVTGWGITEKQEFSQSPLTAAVLKGGRWFCEFKYRRLIDNSQICAGSETSRTCIGDSGGPLSAELNYLGTPRVFQYGLVSYGSQSCTARGTFNVYTKVSHYMEWIVDRIRVFGDRPTSVFIDPSRGFEAKKGLALLIDESCGTTKMPLRVRRVAGGQDAERFANPWMVMVLGENGFICGGSLITSRFVMTAAHCCSMSPKKVRLGGHHMNITDNTYEIDIDRAIPHPQYLTQRFKYDIGLLQMEREVIYSDFVRPICLLDSRHSQMSDVSTFNIAGWGRTEKREHSQTLLTATVHNIDIRYCEAKYSFWTDQSQICAASPTSRACVGDAGGPLSAKQIYGGIQRVFQYGLVGYGSQNCTDRGTYDVYTNVTHYLNWIKDTIKENERDYKIDYFDPYLMNRCRQEYGALYFIPMFCSKSKSKRVKLRSGPNL